METCDGDLIWCGGVLSGRVRSVLVWKKSITFVFDHLDALNSDFPMYQDIFGMVTKTKQTTNQPGDPCLGFLEQA